MYLDDNAQACSSYDAGFVLIEACGTSVHSDKDNKMMVPLYVGYLGESTCGIELCVNNVRLRYARLDFVTIRTPKIMATVGANISGNLRAGISGNNHFDYYHESERFVDKLSSYEVAEEAYRVLKNMSDSKITQYHHNFVTYREVTRAIKEIDKSNDGMRRLMAIRFVLDKREAIGLEHRVSVVTHITYYLVAPIMSVDFLMRLMAQCDSKNAYMKMLKSESQAAKQLQTLFRDDLAQIFELQVLMNRVYDTVDWEKEKKNRQEVKTVPIDSKTVYELSRQIFIDAKKEGVNAKKTKWKDYWNMRWSAMPVGSVISQYKEDNSLKKSLPQDAKVKAAWFCANQNRDHRYWLNRERQVFASTSTKYEWGKVRALYGCDVTSFLHSDFAMQNCEDMLPAYFPVGRRANDKYVKKIVGTFTDGVPLCYDYDDFNSQHSTSSMIAVVMAWRDIFASELSREQQESLEWTIDSISDQVVRFNELGKTERINGTLLSGWRLTSFINTVLNRVYLQKAGLSEKVIYALHNGDDMYATTHDVDKAVKLARKAKALGVRAQLAKTNIGTIGEFLRVDTRATQKTSSQYLARAVSTAVHGRVEMAPANDYRELVRSMMNRFDEIVARGGDSIMSGRMRKDVISFVDKLFDQEEGMAELITQLHPLQGGTNDAADVGKYKIEPTYIKIREESTGYDMLRSGLNDYANYVVERLGIEFDIPNREEMFKRLVNSLVKPKRRYKIVIDTDSKVMIYRGLYKAWKDDKYVNEIALARSLGHVSAKSLPGVNGPLAYMIRMSNDPFKLMSVLM
ncbi:RNA-dependent RNA polymerase [Erysiphe necator associated totivirus 7]|nr:RNA-dependent RNA polymerase [Erysiphe necator associated totivirus 7]